MRHSIYPPGFAGLTSLGFLQKLSTLVELIRLLFYERAFHFPSFAPVSSSVYTLVTHYCLSLLSIWKSCLSSHFLFCVCPSWCDWQSSPCLPVSYHTYFLDLGKLWGFLFTSFCFSFLLACLPDSIHSLSSSIHRIAMPHPLSAQ